MKPIPLQVTNPQSHHPRTNVKIMFVGQEATRF
jgi:hypothetical protein